MTLDSRLSAHFGFLSFSLLGSRDFRVVFVLSRCVLSCSLVFDPRICARFCSNAGCITLAMNNTLRNA